MRFKVEEGDDGKDYSFKFRIVDTTKPLRVRGEHCDFEAICECFDKAAAEMIAAALNARARYDSSGGN